MKYDGRTILIDDVEHLVLGHDGNVAIVQAPDGEEFLIPQSEFRMAVSKGLVRDKDAAPHIRLSTAEEANEHRFRQKLLTMIEQLARSGISIKAAHIEAGRRLVDDPTFVARRRRFPSLRTIQIWRANRRAEGVKGLAPQQHRSGNRKDRHDDLFEDILLDFLDEHFFTSHRLTVSDVEAKVAVDYVERCKELGLKPKPHGRRIVERIIDRVPHDEALKRRLGVKESRKMRIKAVRYATAEAPLDLVELDCTPGDIHFIDAAGQAAGHPTICAAIDVATGFPLGLQLKAGAADSLLVARTIKEVLVPKGEEFFTRFGIEHGFEAFGRFKVLSCDQGSENSGDIIQNAIRVLDFEHRTGLPGHPEKRPHVERFNREVNSFLRKLPGGTGSKLLSEKERTEKAMREACYTLEQIERLLQQWRYDYYGRRPRRRIMSALLTPEAPADCWDRLARGPVLPDPPEPEEIAEIFMVPAVGRTMQHYGIEYQKVQYHGPELVRLLERFGPKTKVEIRFDPTDIRMIMVKDPDTGQHVPVPCKEPDMPAISFKTLAALQSSNPDWKKKDITARMVAVAIATGTYRDDTKPRGKVARRKHDEIGRREREEVARKSRTAPAMATHQPKDPEIPLPTPVLGIPKPSGPIQVSPR